jgi:hypothetical protein
VLSTGLASHFGCIATYTLAAKIQYKFSPQDLASQKPKGIGVCPFGSDLIGFSSLLVLSVPLCWVLCLMEFARVSFINRMV